NGYITLDVVRSVDAAPGSACRRGACGLDAGVRPGVDEPLGPVGPPNHERGGAVRSVRLENLTRATRFADLRPFDYQAVTVTCTHLGLPSTLVFTDGCPYFQIPPNATAVQLSSSTEPLVSPYRERYEDREHQQRPHHGHHEGVLGDP